MSHKLQRIQKHSFMDLPNQPSIDSARPLTLDELKAIRAQFAVWFFAALGMVVCASGMIQIFSVFRANQSLTVAAASPLAMAASFLLRVLIAGVFWVYSGKVGMSLVGRLLVVFSAFIPLLAWVGVYAVSGYTPSHLQVEQDAEDHRDPRFPYWVIPTIPPLMLGGALTLARPEYMSQVFLGPPIGANIPGLPIPCGWPLLFIAFLFVALADMIVWLAYNQRLVRNGWLLLLSLQVTIFFEFPAIWVILLGPAMVQAFKAFISQ